MNALVGCHVQAKSSTAFTTIPKAVETGNLEVVTHARVTRVVTNAGGKVTGVEYVRGNEFYFQPADAVLLASYAYENTRLLLLSTSSAFPNGLANNSGQVGRHYMSHHQGAPVTALFPRDLHNWYGLPAQGVAVDEWADDNFDHSAQDFIGGANLWVHTDRRLLFVYFALLVATAFFFLYQLFGGALAQLYTCLDLLCGTVPALLLAGTPACAPPYSGGHGVGFTRASGALSPSLSSRSSAGSSPPPSGGGCTTTVKTDRRAFQAARLPTPGLPPCPAEYRGAGLLA